MKKYFTSAMLIACMCIITSFFQVLAQSEPELNCKILSLPVKPGYDAIGINEILFSPNGKYTFIAAGNSGIAGLWETSSGTLIKGLGSMEGSSVVSAMAFSPDSKYALTASDSLSLWSTSSGELIKKIGEFYPPIMFIAFSPDGNYALTGTGYEPVVRLWSIPSCTLEKEFSLGMLPVDLAFSPDSKYALIGLNNVRMDDPNIVRLFEVPSFTLVKEMKASDAITTVAVSPNGKYALAGSIGETAWLWEIPSGKLIHEFKAHGQASIYRNEVLMSPDSKYMLMKTWDGKVSLNGIPSGKLIKVFDQTVTSIAFRSDSQCIFAGLWDGSVCVWGVPSGELKKNIHLVEDAEPLKKYEVSFSPDGRFAIAAKDSGAPPKPLLCDISAFTMPIKRDAIRQSLDVGEGIKTFLGESSMYTIGIILALLVIIFLLFYRFFH